MKFFLTRMDFILGTVKMEESWEYWHNRQFYIDINNIIVVVKTTESIEYIQ